MGTKIGTLTSRNSGIALKHGLLKQVMPFQTFGRKGAEFRVKSRQVNSIKYICRKVEWREAKET